MSADERKDEGAGEGGGVAVPGSETSETLTPEEWATIGRDKHRRRELLARMFAIDPHLIQERMAELFQVNRDTISDDMKIIRAAAGERALDQVGEVGETLEQLARITTDALADVPQVQVDSTTRAAHRNTALKALDQKVNVLFRLGYWVEAAKKLDISGGLDLSLYGNLSESARDEIRAVAEGRVFGETDDGGSDQEA